MSDSYDVCVGGSLKLKGDGGVKKKKKKKSKAKEVLETVENVEEKSTREETRNKDLRTPAEKKFAEIQEKRQKERILEKAKKTHKQRVEELNSRLDEMSEHYDIPKVSWTK